MSNVRHFGPTVQLDSGLIIPGGAASGALLQSDSSGKASWTPEPSWVNITSFGTGVSNFSESSPLRVALAFGIIFMAGTIKVGEISVKSTLFSMPSITYWPEHNRVFIIGGIGSSATYGVTVTTTGSVVLEVPAMKSTGTPVGFDSIWFPKKG